MTAFQKYSCLPCKDVNDIHASELTDVLLTHSPSYSVLLLTWAHRCTIVYLIEATEDTARRDPRDLRESPGRRKFPHQMDAPSGSATEKSLHHEALVVLTLQNRRLAREVWQSVGQPVFSHLLKFKNGKKIEIQKGKIDINTITILLVK